MFWIMDEQIILMFPDGFSICAVAHPRFPRRGRQPPKIGALTY